MNGIEKISARILADAEAEAAAIRGQAEEKAAQIAADYDKKIAAEQQRLSAEVEAEAAKQLERDQGAARMAARRQLLETKQATRPSVRPSSSCGRCRRQSMRPSAPIWPAARARPAARSSSSPRRTGSASAQPSRQRPTRCCRRPVSPRS